MINDGYKIFSVAYSLGGVDESLEQLDDDLLVVALGERLHGGLDQVELLLQVVEADGGVDLVPVEHLALHQSGLLQLAVDLLIVQNVKQRLEQDYKSNVMRLWGGLLPSENSLGKFLTAGMPFLAKISFTNLLMSTGSTIAVWK